MRFGFELNINLLTSAFSLSVALRTISPLDSGIQNILAEEAAQRCWKWIGSEDGLGKSISVC